MNHFILSLVGVLQAHAVSTPVCQSPSTLQTDFAQLCRYESANQSLQQASDRMIFFGDSITEMWGANTPVEGALNRGISGQTTQQMLLRFHADVLDLNPTTIHLLAGTNDIAENLGPTNLKRITDNLDAMISLAQAKHIRVVLGSALPTSHYPWAPKIEPATLIVQLNDWIKAKAAEEQLTYVDYYSALVDANGGFSAALTSDGVHPNPTGYAKMNEILKAALAK